MPELLSEEEFNGVLRQLLRHPKEYAAVTATLDKGGYRVSEWMGVLCVEVRGRLLSAREAYAILKAEPALADQVYKDYLAVWR